MNKADLVSLVTPQVGTKKAAEGVVDSIFDAMAKALRKKEDVAIFGFGALKVVQRAARKGRNPQTGEAIRIKASRSVRFTPAKALKEKL